MDLAPPSGLFTPVANAANCTITYPIQSGVTTDENGFPVIASTDGELRARVYNNDGNAADIFPLGSDLEGELLWGRLNDPKAFPAAVKDLAVLTVAFDDGRTGTARLKIKTQNPLMGDVNPLGAKFYLLFRAD